MSGNPYNCALCNITAGDPTSWERHLSGKKHLKKAKEEKTAIIAKNLTASAAGTETKTLNHESHSLPNENPTARQAMSSEPLTATTVSTNKKTPVAGNAPSRVSEECDFLPNGYQLSSLSPPSPRRDEKTREVKTPAPTAPTQSTHPCTLCEINCHTEPALAAHLSGKMHKGVMKAARRGADLYSRHLAINLANFAQHLSMDQPISLVDRADADAWSPNPPSDAWGASLVSDFGAALAPILLELRAKINTSQDVTRWNKFLHAVAIGEPYIWRDDPRRLRSNPFPGHDHVDTDDDEDDFDSDGYDAEGFDRDGYDVNGFDENAYDY
jgi:hypothetical protein